MGRCRNLRSIQKPLGRKRYCWKRAVEFTLVLDVLWWRPVYEPPRRASVRREWRFRSSNAAQLTVGFSALRTRQQALDSNVHCGIPNPPTPAREIAKKAACRNAAGEAARTPSASVGACQDSLSTLGSRPDRLRRRFELSRLPVVTASRHQGFSSRIANSSKQLPSKSTGSQCLRRVAVRLYRTEMDCDR